MSFHGGSRIFQSVAEAIEQREEGDISVKELVITLIKALKAESWSEDEAQVGAFDDDSPVREALREFGVFEICGAEHMTQPWQCDEEKGHAPAMPHKDYRGKTWTEAETLT